MVNLTIDERAVSVPEGTTILEAARSAGIHIPTLCYLKGINEISACRVCLTEIEGYKKLVPSCSTVAQEGMVVHTNSRNVRVARRNSVELILSEHDSNCVLCTRSGNCELQRITQDLNIHHIHFDKVIPTKQGNREFPLIREYSKCIKCMRCVQICDKVQDSRIWDIVNMGHEVTVDTGSTLRLEDSDCALCGQCITHCPVNGLHERDDTDRVYEAINDPEKITVVQIAPSIRTSWGESFGLSPEFANMKRLAAALHAVGFDYIFDTDFSADLTIMEEANEFLAKLKNAEHEKFPMFTSCCPGWVRYCKAHYPEFVDQVSTSKSPQQMFGAIAKSWYAQILDVPPSKLCVVSIMPCIAKKHECAIPNINDADGGRDVDFALTTREMDRMIRSTHIDPSELEERELDMPLGLGSGAGAIFGATGGVMEAALRTAYYEVTGENPDPDAFKDVRGMDGWKEETFDLAGTELRVAVVNGLGNAGRLLDALKRGDVQYDFVEVMACPGGCVGGGGQPIHEGVEMAPSRAKILYDIDAKGSLRFSHENPSIIDCYDKFLGAPLSERAEHLLHTDHHGWKMPNEK